MNRALSVTLLLFGLIVRDANAQCKASDTVSRPGLSRPDPTNPCGYMRIVERDAKGTDHLIFGNPRSGEWATDEIDHRSVIHIGYTNFPTVPGLSISISARVRGPGNASRSLEVPGYSVVGDTATVAGASRLLLPQEFQARMNAFAEDWNRIDTAVVKAIRDTAKAFATTLEGLKSSYSRTLERTRQAVDSLKVLDSILAATPDTAPARAAVQETRGKATQELGVAREGESRASLALSRYLALHAETAKDPTGVHASLGVLRNAFRVRAFVQSLDSGSFKSMVPILALASADEPNQLAALVTNVASNFRAVDEAYLANTTQENSAAHAALLAQTTVDTRTLANLLQSISSGSYVDSYKRLMDASLHISDINLAQSGVETGQTVILIITTLDARDVHRSTEVAVDVTEFGIVRQISDSFLFLKRQRIPKDFQAKAIAEKVAQYDSQTGIQRELLSPEVSVPLSEASAVVPGATFGWNLVPRRTGSWYLGAIRFLQPGFGINASFPTYSNRRIQIIPPDTAPTPTTPPSTTPPVLKGAQLAGPPTIEKESLGIGSGILVSLFNNAISYTYGWHLTTTAGYRRYSGFGISFLSLAQKAHDTYNKLVGD